MKVENGLFVHFRETTSPEGWQVYFFNPANNAGFLFIQR